jgi:quercetin dioxygenase-like cupin family protein
MEAQVVKTVFHDQNDMEFAPHPKFDGVQMAVLITGETCPDASVCVLHVDKGVEIPIHTHDRQADSIFILDGNCEIFINGSWQHAEAGGHVFVPAGVEHGVRNSGEKPLKLFIHHCPALL